MPEAVAEGLIFVLLLIDKRLSEAERQKAFRLKGDLVLTTWIFRFD